MPFGESLRQGENVHIRLHPLDFGLHKVSYDADVLVVVAVLNDHLDQIYLRQHPNQHPIVYYRCP